MTENTTPRGAADSPKLRLLLDSFPEQNPRNFDPDAAIKLNEWGIAIVEELYRLRTIAAFAPVAPTQPAGEIVVTKNDAGHIVAVIRQNAEGGVLSVLAISAPIYEAAPVAPTQPASITLDFKQATELLGMYGGEPTEVTLMVGNGHSGKGVYAHWTSVPEEGAMFLGASDDEAAPVAPTQPDWRELCRRLYVELFHCDKQMTCSLNEDGEPIWRTGPEVRDVLSDAKAALEANPITPEAAPVAPAPQPAINPRTRWLTVVYRGVEAGDEAKVICEHPKVSAVSWSHALDDRDAALAAAPKAAPITDAEQAAWHAGLDEGRSQARTAPSAQDADLRKALHDAATSLETISGIAGKDPYMLEMVDVRLYAAARAKVARAQQEGGEPA